ncbi:MAG: alpha-N-acetylglucosaminidase TIM-barrel domain-containing protein [Acutalibacteraceae bacterium]
MAMNGVNMPLSIIGTQGVWFESHCWHTVLPAGGARTRLSGPGLLALAADDQSPKAPMPPPDRRYVEQSISLGRKILERERSLGMTPIQQGYSGHVPRLFRQKFPQARIPGNGAELVRIPTGGAAGTARIRWLRGSSTSSS